MFIARYFGLLLVLIALLSGCGKDPDTPVAATKNLDALAPRYEASLAEGIDFKKPGYPSFLAEVSGMSGYEPWGRWSLGPVAKFRFKKILPSKFTLLIRANAFGPNVNQPIIVRAGEVEQEFTGTSNATEFTLSFEGVKDTDSIEIHLPKPTQANALDPKSTDMRLIGLAMVFLKLQQ
jgi:phosphoglycerol transferase